MKANRNFGILKAIAFITTVFFFVACNPQDEPVPVVKTTKSAVKIGIAQDVKLSSAKLTAVVVPNEDNTSVAFEYQTPNSTWSTKVLPTKFSGKDSIKVTFDLSDLQLNTVYSFRLRAVNVAGDTVSTVSTFKTYAVSDYDGNLYHTITIGTQTWLQENLKTTHFANGDAIANVKDMAIWGKLTTGAYCKYNNDDKTANTYGNIYNFFVASDSRPLIAGYRVSTYKDWDVLHKKLYTTELEVMNVVKSLIETGKTHWTNPIVEATNSTGFSALPNGYLKTYKEAKSSEFNSLGEGATFWCSDEFNGSGSGCTIDQRLYLLVYYGLWYKTDGMGIRLVKN